MLKESKFTILVATLGRGLSIEWIKQINDYSENGFRIILSIPPNLSKKKIYNLGFNKLIKVINSKNKGQVNQRQYGFRFCETEFIIFMDDDIIFDKDDLKDLFKIYKKSNTRAVIAPIIKDKNHVLISKTFISRLKNLILYSSFNPIPGTIADSSFPVPHNFNENSPKISCKEVDWLPGGLVFLKKDYLIIDNYFPFEGKAYCEDLIHSYLLKSRGIKLFIYYNYKCYTTVDSYRNFTYKEFFSYIKNDYKIRKYLNSIHGGNKYKLNIAYIFIILVFFFNYFFNFRK